jgi:hypothetical protein
MVQLQGVDYRTGQKSFPLNLRPECRLSFCGVWVSFFREMEGRPLLSPPTRTSINHPWKFASSPTRLHSMALRHRGFDASASFMFSDNNA